MPAYCGWAIGGAVLGPTLLLSIELAQRADQTSSALPYFSVSIIAIGVAAAVAGKLRGRSWQRISPPGVLPEVIGWLLAFSVASYIAVAVNGRLEPSVQLFGTYVGSGLVALGVAGTVFGLTGGSLTARRWAARARPPRLAAVAVGCAATLATFVSVYVAIVGAYLWTMLLGSEYGGAVLGGTLGGAVGGGLGEAALWLGIGQMDDRGQTKKPDGR